MQVSFKDAGELDPIAVIIFINNRTKIQGAEHLGTEKTRIKDTNKTAMYDKT